MGLEKFSLEALASMDNGRICAAFEHAMKRCESDCKDRPALKEARNVTLAVSLEPVAADNGELESVNLTFKIKDSVPKRCSKSYNMKAVPGGLLFNDLSPEDVRQGTLDQIGEQGPKEVKSNAS